jgi:exonuclease SbcC
MLESIRLQNFRKHADLTVHFTAGINAIRAANEAGKSTLIEASAYADFGAAGLKESIDDVVTYGLAKSKLRVEKVFTLAGARYKIVRSPSGAEVYVNGKDVPDVTGQKEVTKFMENLYGTTHAMAAKLMLAKQKDLGGALAGGPTEAGQMIEALADLGLIDELVGLVTSKLPQGDTKATQAQIEAWRSLAEPAEVPDLAPLEATVAELAGRRDIVSGMHERRMLELELAQPGELVARGVQDDAHMLEVTMQRRTSQIETLEAAVAGELPTAPAPEEIEALRAKVEQQKQAGAVAGLHRLLVSAKIVPHQWDEPLDKLEAEIAAMKAKVAGFDTLRGATRRELQAIEDSAQQAGADFRQRRAELQGRLIKEDSCAFCGKDLKDVPEVARFNSPLQAELDQLERDHTAAGQTRLDAAQVLRQKIDEIDAESQEAQQYLEALQNVMTAHAKADLLYARAHDYISLDRSGVPFAWSWTGPVETDTTDYATELRGLERRRDAATAAIARRQEQLLQLVALQQEQEHDALVRRELDTDAAQATIVKFQALRQLVQELGADLRAKEMAHREAVQQLELAKVKRDGVLAQVERAKVQLAGAQAQLAEIEANNLLVKKLRAARPAITDKLWAMVLASVSMHTAQMRGEMSVITRDEGRFKINSRPVSGLSGSAEDTLGLGIRIALTRTFLPNVDFLMLDEPAAACEDAREQAMLGLLATCGFDQVILVTHSPLADSFAQNIITF